MACTHIENGTIMLRLTFTLAIALYAGMVVWGEPVERPEAAAVVAASAPVPAVEFPRPAIVDRDAQGEVVVARAAPTETVVPEASAIAAAAPQPAGGIGAVAPLGEPVRISLIEPDGGAAAGAVPAPVAAPAPFAAITDDHRPGERMVVTGTLVNLRAGPSTANAVLDSLPLGTVVDVLGPAGGNWVELREVESGRTGYMSSRFLAPA